MARYSKKSQEEIEEKMHEMKRGELHSGRSGKKVTTHERQLPLVCPKQEKKVQKFPRIQTRYLQEEEEKVRGEIGHRN